MIGAPPAQDEQARLSGARGDFVASLPRRLEVLRGALRAVEDQPRDPGRINGFLRRLHALGSAARVLGFASVAEALAEAEKTLRRVARAGPAPTDLAEMARALDLLPSLVLGAKVSIRAVVPALPVQEAQRDFPLGVLVFGPQSVVEQVQYQADLPIECACTEDPAKARELSRVFGPDVAVVDADREGARELIEFLLGDPQVDPVPILVVGELASPEAAAGFLALGAARVLGKPLSPELLRRTLRELREHGSPRAQANEPFGELNVSQLVDRITSEIRRGLVEAVEPAARRSSVAFGEGTEVMSAVWGAVARLRELVTLRSDGNVRFEATGPEGAVPFAPWNDDRRLGERGAREGRASEGVSLQGRRIVVADDDPAVVWFLAGILKAVGAEVFEAHDGERAFELTSALWPDLVVSDVLMPKLDGFSLCHEIKRDVAVRDVPVILLSWKEDLLQRVRELGADADGYLRKEAAASTVVERLREVLRARSRVEQRVANGGEVRGRLDGITPRLVLDLVCRSGRDVRVSIRDSSYLYEVQVRAGEPRTAIRSATDGTFERGEGVLSMLLGVSAGRFVIEPDESPCRGELSGALQEQLAGPIARARAAQRAVSVGSLAHVTRVAFDAGRVGSYLECTPEPARSLLRELIQGASPRDLLASGGAPARLLEAVLSDFARRGAILAVETAGGVEDISQTRIPPAVVLPVPRSDATPEGTVAEVPLAVEAVPELAVEAVPEPVAEAVQDPAGAEVRAAAPVAEETLAAEVAPVSQRRAPAVYSQPPDSELESADAGWFSLQIESSVAPPLIAQPSVELVAAQPFAPADPLRSTLNSSGPAQREEFGLPGSSVPVERGYRPDPLATATLGSAGNEAAAAIAAAGAAEDRDAAANTPSDSDDPLAQALLAETPSPAAALPVAARPIIVHAPRPPAPQAPANEPTEAFAAGPGPSSRAPRATASSPPPSSASARTDADQGGVARTLVLALLAAAASFAGVRFAAQLLAPEGPDAATATAPSTIVPLPAPASAAVPRLLVRTSESPLPPDSGVAAGSGLLEVEVPEATAIRVDGEYLGMGPKRRVPLLPGPHELGLGDGIVSTVAVRAGVRTLAVATPSGSEAVVGSP